MWSTTIISIVVFVSFTSAQLPNYFQSGSPAQALGRPAQSQPSWQSSGPTRSWFSGPGFQSSSPNYSQYQPYRPSAPAVPTVSSIPSPTLSALSGYNRFQSPSAPQPSSPSWSQWSGAVNRFSGLSQPSPSYSSIPRPAAPQLTNYARPAPAPIAQSGLSANPSFLPQPQNPWGTPNNVQFTVNHQTQQQAAPAPAAAPAQSWSPPSAPAQSWSPPSPPAQSWSPPSAPAQSWSPPAPAPQVYSPPARPAQTWSAPPPTTSSWSAPSAPSQSWTSQPSAPTWSPPAAAAPQPAAQPASTYQSPQNSQNMRPAPVHYASIGPQLQGDLLLKQFGYHTGDGGSFREETRLPDGTVQGAYGFTDADGKQRIVRYTAGKNGFQANGDDVPKAAAPVASPSGETSAPASATINVDEGAAFRSFQQG